MRYGKSIRIVVSGLFIIQMVLYMSIVMYAPALALSAVTDLTTEMSIIVIGGICTIYCALGGLKAVLWTDAFQSGFMYICLLVVFIAGIIEVGGLSEVIQRSKDGLRWEFFNFSVDLTTRYTVWNALFRGLSLGVGGYGVSQLEIQRLLSLDNVKHAQSALLWSIGPMMIIVFMSYSMGLILYGVFYICDPILNAEQTGLRKHDQLIPYFIVTRLGHIPGLTGLCIAGLFSGSLSTVSSAVNSISTVTVVDFIQPYCCCVKLNDKALLWSAKSLVILYGCLCIGVTFLLARVGSLTQMATVSTGIMEGPVTAIFLLGMLTTMNDEKGSVIGFLTGCMLSGWIGYGSALSGFIYPPLPTSDEGCSRALNITESNSSMPSVDNYLLNMTSEITGDNSSITDIFILYRTSYMWIPTLGFIFTAAVSYSFSILMNWNKKRNVDMNVLSPVVILWMPNAEDEYNLNIRKSINLPENGTQWIKRRTIADCTL